jgi:Tfp pilus assembly protein PilF
MLRPCRRISQAIVVACLLASGACSSGPPVQEMSDARQAITAAREAGAAQLAPGELRDAEDRLDSALRNLSRKDYALARDDAIGAKNSALMALASSEKLDGLDPRN